MKFYLYFESSIFITVLDIEEVKKDNENLYNKIIKNNFDVGVCNEFALSNDFEYKDVYEIESSYTKEQLLKVLEQEFYIDVLEIAKVLGKVKQII